MYYPTPKAFSKLFFEAMACGTHFLANPLGAIPDIVKEGKIGFLMENHSPECIVSNIIPVLDYPDLDGVARRAPALVEREYTFERGMVKWWRMVQEEVGNDER